MVQKQHKDSKELLEERHIQGFDFGIYMTAPVENGGESDNNTETYNFKSELVGDDVDNMRAFGGVKDGQ